VTSRSMTDVSGETPPHHKLVPRAMTGLAIVFAGWILATTFYAVIVTYSPLPFWDAWREVTATQHLTRLADQHNEHRIVLSRLIFVADKLWFDGSNKLSLAMTFVIQAMHAVFSCFFFHKLGGLNMRRLLVLGRSRFRCSFGFGKARRSRWASTCTLQPSTPVYVPSSTRSDGAAARTIQ
jgi:hypothetical protein